VVEVPSRRVLATTESNSDDEDEEEEDDLDWEEDGNDQDGDWQMDQTSPDRSHLRVAPPPVSGRTGERDTRSEQAGQIYGRAGLTNSPLSEISNFAGRHFRGKRFLFCRADG
jgi:hypothetical protein